MSQPQIPDNEIARLRYPFRTFEEFCELLTSSGIVDSLAIEDYEDYDGGAELSRIEKAYNRVLNELKDEARLALTPSETNEPPLP
jgi:hypothetical protein